MDLPMYEQYLVFLHDQLRVQLANFSADAMETDYNNNPWHLHNRNQTIRKMNHFLNYDMFSGNERQPFWQPWLDMQREEDASVGKSAKQLPTTKWKRDRRTRPDYLRKSDPKIASDSHESNGANGTDKSSSASSTSSSATMSPVSTSPNSNKSKRVNGVAGSEKLGDAPLDMTTSARQRGLPPSYSQAMSDPSFRSSYTNSRPSTNGRDDIPTGISMCDPIIDEHFRRSLGKDYNTVFNNNAKENPLKPSKPPIVLPSIAPSEVTPVTPPIAELPKAKSPAPRPSSVTSVIEMMDSSGMSVDDHFAKALGDTWHKLNKKDSNPSENNGVSTVTSTPAEVVST